jgi:hypothetical protein
MGMLLTLDKDALHTPFHQLTCSLELLLILCLLAQKSADMGIGRLYHRVESVGIAFTAVSTFQPRDHNLYSFTERLIS